MVMPPKISEPVAKPATPPRALRRPHRHRADDPAGGGPAGSSTLGEKKLAWVYKDRLVISRSSRRSADEGADRNTFAIARARRSA
jgi:hypothetical protein